MGKMASKYYVCHKSSLDGRTMCSDKPEHHSYKPDGTFLVHSKTPLPRGHQSVPTMAVWMAAEKENLYWLVAAAVESAPKCPADSCKPNVTFM
jgi:hypothetical protein